jgi:hypothetical protein
MYESQMRENKEAEMVDFWSKKVLYKMIDSSSFGSLEQIDLLILLI